LWYKKFASDVINPDLLNVGMAAGPGHFVTKTFCSAEI
jgi:hypothetical protein